MILGGKCCDSLRQASKNWGLPRKIPEQIRIPPELDCISLKGVKEHVGPFEDINFSDTIGTEGFSGGMRGACCKSGLVWGVHKENGAGAAVLCALCIEHHHHHHHYNHIENIVKE